MNTDVTIRHVGGTLVATLPDEIDLSNIDGVRSQVLLQLHRTTRGLVLNLSNNAYMDAKGIRLLIDLQNRLVAASKPFRLVVRPDAVLTRVLDVAGVTIPSDVSLEDALRAMKTTSAERLPYAFRSP